MGAICAGVERAPRAGSGRRPARADGILSRGEEYDTVVNPLCLADIASVEALSCFCGCQSMGDYDLCLFAKQCRAELRRPPSALRGLSLRAALACACARFWFCVSVCVVSGVRVRCPCPPHSSMKK